MRERKRDTQQCTQVVMFAALLLWVLSKLCGLSVVPAEYLLAIYTAPTFANLAINATRHGQSQ